MAFSNKRNSRDDKSSYQKRSFTSRSSDSRERKSNEYGASKKRFREDRSGSSSNGEDRKYNRERPYSSPSSSRESKGNFREEKKFDRGDKKFPRGEKNFERGDKPFERGDRSFSRGDRNTDRRERNFDRDRGERTFHKGEGSSPRGEKSYPGKPRRFQEDADRNYRSNASSTDRGGYQRQRPASGRNHTSRSSRAPFSKEPENDGQIRLNRYISNAGICSRRKADELIQAGVVSVNGQVVTELGTKVDPTKDEIRYNGERLKREKMVYVLLNKPKDYITTTDDPQERRTVMQLVSKATKERIYPVGRLDRNTTGLLLLTNDGNLAEKLSHPRNNIVKMYHVELSKNLTQGDLNKIAFGIELEDGLIKPDDISYVAGASKKEVGIQIHSGRNRIVRRIFESLGYEVVKLDRVVYANLTKKDLPRGRWRYLEERELIQLRHFIK